MPLRRVRLRRAAIVSAALAAAALAFVLHLRADKRQVTTMVTHLLGLDQAPKPADAADALALAICHVWRGGTQSRLAEAAEAHARTAPTRYRRPTTAGVSRR